ncbi:MAG TPA: hypothetical protein VI750_14810, partial [Pyrinomonadaceae bacterium]|nr:hypothetical protein [Pyrinomonadaceae bacterium]
MDATGLPRGASRSLLLGTTSNFKMAPAYRVDFQQPSDGPSGKNCFREVQAVGFILVAANVKLHGASL